MKIKYIGKSGKREVKSCKCCNELFETLSTKVRQGGELFCSVDCYRDFRKPLIEDKKHTHIKHQRKYKYGLEEEDFNNLLKESNNLCMICSKEFTKESRYTTACVDHCHETGIVRGLLCHKCNKGLGAFNDNITLLETAIKYLSKIKINK